LQHPRAALRVAVVGLGIGTLAGYGRAGDQYRFYEINPQVVDVARDTNQFTCLSRTAATVEFVLGDARLTLAREAAANDPPWDVLVVDAFSGDAVPVHLLTREAVALFLGRTAPDGITAFHISNWFIDLLPLLKAAAKAEGVHLWAWHNLPQGSPIESDSRWVLMTRKPRVFRAEGAMLHLPEAIIPDHPVMTDEKGSILPLVDWRRNRLGRYFQAAREFQANPPK
jgi:spermidine synthase